MSSGSLFLQQNILENASLPLKPDPVYFKGKIIILEPFDIERDLEALFNVSNGSPIILGDKYLDAYDCNELIWKYLPCGPFENLENFRELYAKMLKMPNMLILTVFDACYYIQVGVVTMMRNRPLNLAIELGHIWYSPIAQRTGANIEACYLLLKHLFELGYRRVEWKCNSLNERSRASALKIGFKFEFIQEFHMISKGCSRDSAWFRILDYEWKDIQFRLKNLLYKS